MAGRNISKHTKRFLQGMLDRIDLDAYWGVGDKKTCDKTIKLFKINVPDETLDDLQSRLTNTRQLTPPLQGIQQQYGFNTDTLQDVMNFWKNDYDWREREKTLNTLPQFTTEIQGLDIHYIRSRPRNTNRALPLLILHGWPGSVKEFYDIIPLLTGGQDAYDFAFDVIAPSLPGFIFSGAAAKPGLGAVEMGVVFRNFMERLGFEEFYVHGGDWGGLIVKHMATLFPENVLGLHSNFCFARSPKTYLKYALGRFYPESAFPKGLKGRMYPLRTYLLGLLEETGYFHIQATKPDTIGVALNDSPAGLASYILEKFSTYTFNGNKYIEGGGLLEKFTYADLLDNIMLYWVTNSFTTAMRIYAESFTKNQMALNMKDIPIDMSVPCAIARFPHEIFLQPDFMLRDKYQNIIQSTDFDRGGHFAAFEEPKLLADDLYSAVDKMEKFRNCNANC